MPKLKTNKRAMARFRITGTGKIVRMKGQSTHLRRKKPARVKRQYSRKLAVSPSFVQKVKRMLPYGVK